MISLSGFGDHPTQAGDRAALMCSKSCGEMVAIVFFVGGVRNRTSENIK
jgi:hypothetical protein